MSDFTAPPAAQARLTNLRTGAFLTLVYPPTGVSRSKGSNWEEAPTPGFSDPMLSWSSGKTQFLKFKLELCAESRQRFDGVTLGNGLSPYTVQSQGEAYDLTGEIELMESWEYPVDPSLPGSDGAPDRLVFNFGPTFRGVVCWLYAVNIDITAFGLDGSPIRASADFTLAVKSDRNRYASHIWTPPTEGFQT